MKYFNIKQKLEKSKVFSVEDLLIIDPGFRIETLYEWEKKDWVKKLRNKRYIFSDLKPTNYDLYLIANKIYSPSYISLELALNHFGVIPEAVMRITSITTNKTLSVDTDIAIFDYKTVDEKLFFGYQLITSNDITYKIATLEKALIDYLYLNSDIESVGDFDSLRFNIDVLNDSLDIKKLKEIVNFINSQTLTIRINLLLKYINL